MVAWSREDYVGETPAESAVKNAAALGGIRVVDQAIGIIEEYRELVDLDVKKVL